MNDIMVRTTSQTQFAGADTKYWLSRGEAEVERLNEQHTYLKKVLNRNTALPSSIDPNSISTVFDVGAGCLSWTLDFARTPEIAGRLSPTSRNPVELYACDLSSAQFPPREVIDALGIKAFEHDVTKSFPPKLQGKFDLVHMRLLVFALSEQDWKKVLSNLRELLKPGGHLVLVDLNARWYYSQADFTDDWRYIPGSKSRKPTWIDTFNDVMRLSVMEKNGFVPDLVYRLPSLLTSTAWSIQSRTPFVTPIGRRCRTYPGPLGQSLASEEEPTIRLLTGVYEAVTRNALKEGTLAGPQGKMRTEKERQEFVSGMVRGLREEGGLAVWVEIIARKDY